MIKATFKRLPNVICQMYHLREVQCGNYIPPLYLNSGFKFDLASDNLERSIRQFTSNFKSTLNRLQQRRDVAPNLPPHHFDLVLWLKDHPDYIVVKGDKNFGSCVLERSYYT